MTVSEFEAINRHMESDVAMFVAALIADWRVMRLALTSTNDFGSTIDAMDAEEILAELKLKP